ncbi:hypothetical protein [Sporisorium scitamineum]|uniref:Uncharacterized protein n=1 Tax=Sporisorium scitamineum TaxID=49012 RepID=A0A0F7S6J2_9BASI|nr:hypothetical protein [Sporisorium scitamineum]
MEEPPFQMAGHRWDPEKKRFFKIVPSLTHSLNGNTASSSKSSGEGSKRSKGNKKAEEAQILSAENRFASTPRLPAIDLRTADQKLSTTYKSAFRETISDPITLKQHGASPVKAKAIGERSRIEAAYSNLALLTARMPDAADGWPETILSIQTDVGGHVPFIWRNSQGLLLGDGRSHQGKVNIDLTLMRSSRRTDGNDDTLNPMWTALGLCRGQPCCSRCGTHRGTPSICQEETAYERHYYFFSHVMAITFDAAGEALYFGTRSGQVLVCQDVAAPLSAPVEMPIEADGSVTNLAFVSSSEMLIVRINGQVELVDVATSQVKCRYQGHVNSYSFTLGMAVDKELRLFALAGLDRRVRIWSLDSPLPLGTSATSLPPVFHRHDHDHRLDNEALYDESGSSKFTRAHTTLDDKAGMRRGSTLSTVVFPNEVGVLHWHPRYRYEGRDPHEVEALRQEQGANYRPPAQRWKDLYVAAGYWLYQFRFP